jgi:putative ABC transport system substrate-binding protein
MCIIVTFKPRLVYRFNENGVTHDEISKMELITGMPVDTRFSLFSRILLQTCAILTLPLFFGVVAHAQQTKKVYRIGYLSGGSSIQIREEAFRQALRELGYTEGQNLVIEWRFAKGRMSQRPELAAELVDLKVECIVATGSGETAVARKATTTIPIVMMSSTDPLGTGFVVSLARPGGNITGLTSVIA